MNCMEGLQYVEVNLATLQHNEVLSGLKREEDILLENSRYKTKIDSIQERFHHYQEVKKVRELSL